MTIKPGSRLLFIGDSVTDCGRKRPVGSGEHSALGQGYVAEVDSALAVVNASRPITVLNMGVSGDTVRDLASRWDRDVLALKPDWLSVMIGINDVWRQFDGADPSAAVMPDEFERTYEGLILRTRPQVRRLVLMTPFYVQDTRIDPMRRRMDVYGGIVKRLAARNAALLVDTQAALDRSLAATGYQTIAPDRVHPTEVGHGILAQSFLRAVGVTPHSRR